MQPGCSRAGSVTPYLPLSWGQQQRQAGEERNGRLGNLLLSTEGKEEGREDSYLVEGLKCPVLLLVQGLPILVSERNLGVGVQPPLQHKSQLLHPPFWNPGSAHSYRSDSTPPIGHPGVIVFHSVQVPEKFIHTSIFVTHHHHKPKTELQKKRQGGWWPTQLCICSFSGAWTGWSRIAFICLHALRYPIGKNRIYP